MRRTQILLDDWQYESLKSLAEKEGSSMANMIREAVSDYLATEAEGGGSGLLSIEGIGEDPEARGRDHDAQLYDLGASDRKRQP